MAQISALNYGPDPNTKYENWKTTHYSCLSVLNTFIHQIDFIFFTFNRNIV